MSDLRQALTNPSSYQKAIQQSRYHSQLSTKQIENISFNLANLVQNGRFEFAPASQTQYQRFDGAWRPCLQYSLNDFLVNKVITNSLTQSFEPKCSPNVYGFMPHRSGAQAVAKFCHFLKTQVDQQGKLDIWMIMSDIKNAHQSFPIHKNSLLWEKLGNLIYPETEPVDPYIDALITASIAPYYYTKDKKLAQHNAGLPTGNPISNILQNIYLTEVDELIPKCPDIFYARYGDDVLIAGNNKQTILDWEEAFFSCLKKLALTPNMQKHQHIYFSKNGYRSNDVNFVGKNTLFFLRQVITADGSIYLPKIENHLFYVRCRQSIMKNHHLCRNKLIDEQGKFICHRLADELLHLNLKNTHKVHTLTVRPDSNKDCNIMLCAHSHSFLKEMDRKIAEMIAEELSGIAGSKAFRVIPYKKIRAEWGLPSLVKMVNQFHSVRRNGLN